MTTRLSVVIRSFNEERHIGRLLTGIVRQSVPTPEIILVDSGSTDATVAIASRYPVTIVQIQPSEFTFGRSLNRGIAAIRRTIWQDLPYDEALTGLEDIDWGRRILERGHRLAYVAEAEVAHVHEETPSRIYNRYRREAMALKNIFPEERFGLRDFLRL